MKKRWIALVLAGACVANQFVPFSLGGPAMSCMTAYGKFAGLKSAVNEFMAVHGNDHGEVLQFLNRSDFRVRNLSFESSNDTSINARPKLEDRMLTLVMVGNDANWTCATLAVIHDLPGMDKNLLLIELQPHPVFKNRLMVSKVTNNYGS
jgi:hypothetical protein